MSFLDNYLKYQDAFEWAIEFPEIISNDLVFEGFDQMQELDIVEAYIMVEVPR